LAPGAHIGANGARGFENQLAELGHPFVADARHGSSRGRDGGDDIAGFIEDRGGDAAQADGVLDRPSVGLSILSDIGATNLKLQYAYARLFGRISEPVENLPAKPLHLRELTARAAVPADLKGTRETPGEVAGVALRLTSRETQILRLVWKGHSNKAIARDLFLAENTIETHLRRINEKLGTRKRTQAAALARESGAI